MFYILSKNNSRKSTAGRLSQVLEMPLITPQSVFEKKKVSLILNYGVGSIPPWLRSDPVFYARRFLNSPLIMENSINKIKTLQILTKEGVPTLEWTNNPEVVHTWLKKGYAIFVRTLVRSKKGKGIIIVDPNADEEIIIPKAKLYTRQYKKTHEFRIFVFRGKVIERVQKRQMSPEKLKEYNINSVNRDIRSYENGWVFSKQDIFSDPLIDNLAIQTCQVLNLDFAAVDIGAVIKDNSVINMRVFETNTAPRIESDTTFKNLVYAIGNYFGGKYQSLAETFYYSNLEAKKKKEDKAPIDTRIDLNIQTVQLYREAAQLEEGIPIEEVPQPVRRERPGRPHVAFSLPNFNIDFEVARAAINMNRLDDPPDPAEEAEQIPEVNNV